MKFSVPMLIWFALVAEVAATSSGHQRELLRDPHFQFGFHLLEPKPGKRVVYAKSPSLAPGPPVWDLAQWSSRFPLTAEDWASSRQSLCLSNEAKCVIIPGRQSPFDLSLAVYAETEYPVARKLTSEPWVHLLVQQDILDPPSLGTLRSCTFNVEARLRSSTLVGTNDYSPAIHAAQFLVYLTIANRNPAAAGYQECFWFGIPIYDNRARIIPAYEAQDFGDTKLFIFTPSSDTFTSSSTHDGAWVTFTRDLLPLLRRGLEQARNKGFIKGSQNLADYQPLGIFVGWEVPGRFNVDLEIRNLSLKADTL